MPSGHVASSRPPVRAGRRARRVRRSPAPAPADEQPKRSVQKPLRPPRSCPWPPAIRQCAPRRANSPDRPNRRADNAIAPPRTDRVENREDLSAPRAKQKSGAPLPSADFPPPRRDGRQPTRRPSYRGDGRDGRERPRIAPTAEPAGNL